MWTQEKIHNIVQEQKSFFQTGRTLDISWRKEQLRKLKQAVIRYEPELEEALKDDLGRSRTEGYFCDIGRHGNLLSPKQGPVFQHFADD